MKNKLYFHPSPSTFPQISQDLWINNLHARYFEKDKQLPIIIFCHGNAGNIDNRMYLVPLFQSINCNLLIFDYSGYGKSLGKPSEKQLYQDVSQVIEYTQSNLYYPINKIILYGESIGCPIASYGANKYQIPQLILQSGPSSILDFCYHKLPRWIYYFLYPMVYSDLPTSKYLDSYSGKCLIIHGNQDTIIPVDHAHILHQTTSHTNLQIVEGGHNNLDIDYLAIKKFIFNT